MRETRFCSGVRGLCSPPPMNGEPAETALPASPNSHSDAQSEMPGMIVLSVADGSHPSAGAGGADAGGGAAGAGDARPLRHEPQRGPGRLRPLVPAGHRTSESQPARARDRGLAS